MKIGRSRILQSTKYTEQKRKKNIVAIVLILSCCIAIILLIILIFRSPFLKINNFVFTGVNTINTDELKNQLVNSLDGNIFYFIPKSTIFTYSDSDIEDRLLKSSPKILSLDVESKGISTIQVNINERVAVAVGCEGFKEDNIQDDTDDLNCYVLDKDAIIFDKYSNDYKNTLTKYYLSSNTESLKIGSYFIDTTLFQELEKLIKNVKVAGIPVKGLLIGDDGSYELYVRNSDYSTAVVYFDDRSPFETTYSNLIIFWNNSLKKDFDYINLKFGNNIFFTNKTEK